MKINKSGVYIVILVLLISFITAWTPPSNADFLNYYSIQNVTNITANLYCNATTCLTLAQLAAGGSGSGGSVTLINTPGPYIYGGPINETGNVLFNTTESRLSLEVNRSTYWANVSTYDGLTFYKNGEALWFNHTKNNATINIIASQLDVGNCSDDSTCTNIVYYSNTSNWDKNKNDNVNVSTQFDGDVSGTFNALLVDDDSHKHSCINITGATSDLCTIVDTDTTYTNSSPISLVSTTFGLLACPNGYGYFYNTSISQFECQSKTATGGSGTVTSVAFDEYYITGGPITVSGTGTFNETRMNATINTRSLIVLNSNEANLNVNSSDYWDALDSPADINAADITDDGTYIKNASETDLNVNSSNYWDALDSPADFSWSGDLSGSGLNPTVDDDSHSHTNLTVSSLDWDKLQTYPTACPANTYVTEIGDSSTCTGISDVYLLNTGDIGTGVYNFTGNVTIKDHFRVDQVNITCFNTACTMFINATNGCIQLTSGGKICSGV